MLTDAALSAALNVVILAGLPFLGYFVFHRRKGRSFGEIARRAGLQVGELRYLGYSAAFAVAHVIVLRIWPLPLEPFVREGSATASFVGLGSGGIAVSTALLYGVVKTGFSEELLFRGLIAGSFSRRMSLWRANLVQAFIFLLPHFLVLLVMPEMWGLLPVVFLFALFMGWVRIRSGSILGPWLMHAVVNFEMCLSVAARTASG
jgi:membrane protease YdiL (CAAX protease family)